MYIVVVFSTKAFTGIPASSLGDLPPLLSFLSEPRLRVLFSLCGYCSRSFVVLHLGPASVAN